MACTNQSETPMGREVERLFGEISAKRGDLCTNPVTGGEFVYGFDSIKRQKDAAYKRLLISEYFALNGPPDAPLMPTDDTSATVRSIRTACSVSLQRNTFGRSKISMT